jgi:hypothetical protein
LDPKGVAHIRAGKEGHLVDTAAWDWSTSDKAVAEFGACSTEVGWLEEPCVSPDGEKIARVANVGEGEFAFCVNGQIQGEETFERIWYPRFSPDGRLTGIAASGGEWTLSVDGENWDTYGYLMQTQFSSDGKVIACAVQQDGEYGMVVDNAIWENLYGNANHFILSPNGKRTAAAVQLEPLDQADIAKFQKGIWGVAVDGNPWPDKYVDVFGICFSPDGSMVAAEIRTTLWEYTIAVDGKPWKKTFPCVWTPIFNPRTGQAVAPVRLAGKWTLAADGEPIWKRWFTQCWHPFFSSDGKRLAAIVAPKFGRWTVAVDGTPWGATFGDLVTDALFSPTGNHVAALGKEDEKWSVVLDGEAWGGRYDMAWKPVFSPDGAHCAAKVEKNGAFTYVIDGREVAGGFEHAWDPIFSPAGDKLLLRVVDRGTYRRRVVPVAKLVA